MKQKNRMILNTGTTSLVLIFVVLALVTFAALSLASASAGWRLADKMADRTTRYYEAQNQALETLADVEAMVDKVRRESSREDFTERMQTAVERMGAAHSGQNEEMAADAAGTGEKLKTADAAGTGEKLKTVDAAGTGEKLKTADAAGTGQKMKIADAAGTGQKMETADVTQKTGSIRWEDGLICWEVSVSERQQIEAAVRPEYDVEPGTDGCVIESWSVTDTGDWNGSQALELYR